MKCIPSTITKSLLAILMSGGLFTANMQAQDAQGVIATIPFAFSAANQNIAAGTYRLDLLSDQFLLSIRNVKTGKKQFITVRPEEGMSPEPHGRLIFHRYEGHSALAEIHIPGTSMYSVLIQERRKKIAEARTDSVSDVEIMASR